MTTSGCRALRANLATGCAAALALLVGCAAEDARSSAGPALPADVVLKVHQYRSDEVNQVLAVGVGNGSREPVTIETLDVRAPGFDGPGRVEFGATIGPGRTYDLRVPLGTPTCDEPLPDDDLVVRVGLAGHQETVDVVPAEGAAMMRQIHTDMCTIESALAELPMHWSNRWQRRGDTVSGTLVVGPATSDGPVSVTGTAATTLVSPIGHPLPRTVRPGQTARIEVRFAPTRCDGHAFADNNTGLAVPFWLELPGGQETSVPVTPARLGQQRVLDHLLAVCGLQE